MLINRSQVRRTRTRTRPRWRIWRKRRTRRTRKMCGKKWRMWRMMTIAIGMLSGGKHREWRNIHWLGLLVGRLHIF